MASFHNTGEISVEVLYDQIQEHLDDDQLYELAEALIFSASPAELLALMINVAQDKPHTRWVRERRKHTRGEE